MATFSKCQLCEATGLEERARECSTAANSGRSNLIDGVQLLVRNPDTEREGACDLHSVYNLPCNGLVIVEHNRTHILVRSRSLTGARVQRLAQQMVRDISLREAWARRIDKKMLKKKWAGAVEGLATALDAGSAGASQSNVVICKAVRSMEELVRTHKIVPSLARNLGVTLANSCMTEHCADIVNRCQVGKDGAPQVKDAGGTIVNFFGSPVVCREKTRPTWPRAKTMVLGWRRGSRAGAGCA